MTEQKEHYTVAELARELSFSRYTVTRLFANEPGVLKFSNEGKRHKRTKTTLRIPASVKERVMRKFRVS